MHRRGKEKAKRETRSCIRMNDLQYIFTYLEKEAAKTGKQSETKVLKTLPRERTYRVNLQRTYKENSGFPERAHPETWMTVREA